MENRVSQTENGIGILMMYLYQSYTTDLGMSPGEAKQAVINKVNEEVEKFSGTKNNVPSKSNFSSVNNVLIDEINKCIDGIRSQLKAVNQPMYLVNKIDSHLKELIKKE